LLIADTGVKGSLQVPNSSLLYSATGNDYQDVALDAHGSFVYSEVVDSRFGILPKQNVDVAKIAYLRLDSNGKPLYEKGKLAFAYDLIALSEAVRKFAVKYGDVQVPPSFIGVVNISFSGQAPENSPPPPFLGGGQQGNAESILFVADEDATKHVLFDLQNNPATNLIIVGALGPDGKRASYSNFGQEHVDLFTQGSCVCGGTTAEQINGTSQASPIVATAAATLAANRPGWGPQDIKWRLISTSDLNKMVGGLASGGVLNLRRAMQNGIALTREQDLPDGSTQIIEENPKAISITDATERLSDVLGLKANSDLVVLRLIRRDCSVSVRDFVCFRRYTLSRTPDAEILIPRTAQLEYSTGTSTPTKIKIDTLWDLILPVHQDKRIPSTLGESTP
jgi:subtilisin family serine protease